MLEEVVLGQDGDSVSTCLNNHTDPLVIFIHNELTGLIVNLMNIQFVEIFIDILSRWVNLISNSEIVDSHSEATFITIISHRKLCMSILSICILN